MKNLIFSDYRHFDLAKKIGRELKFPCQRLVIKKFPDGELYLRFPSSVKGNNVILVFSSHPQPDESLLESYFAVKTAKDLGAKKVILVIPYLFFMRQDKRFNPGECLSSRIMAGMLSAADYLITVDPHLHRYKGLKEIFTNKAIRLSANRLLADYIKKHFKNPIIIGPDIESYQWAETIAYYLHLHAYVLRKERFTSRRVKIKLSASLEKEDFQRKEIIIVDDIISTGKTILETIKNIKSLGGRNINCLVVHGIFAEKAREKIRKTGTKVISSNTISSPVAKIDVSSLISKEIKKLV